MPRHPLPRPIRIIAMTVLFAVVTTIQFSFAVASHPPAPPGQPTQGPGGSDTPFNHVIATRVGEPPTGYWLYEPATGNHSRALRPDDPQPLVIFLHGFTAVDPVAYLAWIEHIVRRGAIVIYPDYQTFNPLDVSPTRYLPNIVTAIQDALVVLQGNGRTPVDHTRVAVVGHSIGGILTVNLAAIAERAGLPIPHAIMPVEPGGCLGCGSGPDAFGVPLADLSSISPATLALVVVGEDDDVVGNLATRLIWDGMTAVPLDQRDLVLIRSDNHGEPDLSADHYFPLTGSALGTVDALDWYGTWKLFDGLTACAFKSDGCDRALGGTSFQRGMGEWSDATLVVPAIISDEL